MLLLKHYKVSTKVINIFFEFTEKIISNFQSCLRFHLVVRRYISFTVQIELGLVTGNGCT